MEQTGLDWTEVQWRRGSLSKSFEQNEGGEQETGGGEKNREPWEARGREGGGKEMIERIEGRKIAYCHAIPDTFLPF